MVKILVAVLCLSGPASALAANHYVRAAATGTASGDDWTNARPDLPASLIRGDTYYVAAGSYPSHNFADAVNGLLVITIKAATVADHGTSVGWSDPFAGQATWAANTFSVWAFTAGGYYTIDGVTGSGPGTTTYGFRLDKSGTTTTGCGGTAGSALQIEANITNITVRHVEIKGTSDVTPDPNNINDKALLIRVGANNLILQNMWVHDQGGGWGTLDGVDNALIENSFFRNTHSTPACHSEGFALRAPSGIGNTNITFRYNVFENADGTAYIGTPVNTGVTSSNWYIYGNVFAYNAGDSHGQSSAAGAMQLFSLTQTGDFFFYNNVISALDRNSGLCGIVNGGSVSVATLTVRNNIWYNCAGSVNPFGGATTLVWTHNAYFDTSTADTDVNKQVASGNPFVDVSQTAGHNNFHLVNATTAGVTLSSPYNADPDGIARGLDGTWDRGAYEKGSVFTYPGIYQ